MPVASTVLTDVDGAPAGESVTVRLSRAWRELRRGAATNVLVERLFGRPGEPDSIEPGHLDVLDLLARQDGQRMSDLAVALHVDPSTVTRTMHRIEAAGLARRAAVSADGRVVTANLTDEGRRVHALVSARRAAFIEAALRDFSTEDRELLVDLLERFVENLHAATGGSPSGVGG